MHLSLALARFLFAYRSTRFLEGVGVRRSLRWHIKLKYLVFKYARR